MAKANRTADTITIDAPMGKSVTKDSQKSNKTAYNTYH
ncbi:hypothetical protein MBGDF03_01177, partial [Thermoplasmatales archaeon SCGC AB-540-F20]